MTRARRFVRYWLNAVDDHSLQAPFIFDFYQQVVNNKTLSTSMKEVIELRESLLKNHHQIRVMDFGTGGAKSRTRSISGMARKSHQPKVSRMLFNICRKYRPQSILELGTNLGLSTLSMAAGAQQAEIITIEGCPETSRLAQKHFSTLNLSHIELVTGTLDKVLPQVLAKLNTIDLLFIDANHRYEPTIKYIEQCLPYCHAQSIVVVDDIYHSSEMERAWDEIKQHPQTKITVDLFQTGLVFFNPQLSKTHYVLQF
jgi:predicted O-methyltransferase YrrM